MKENWDRAVSHLLRWEGGFADRSDPVKYPHPEFVNHGVTLATYQRYHPGATKDDIRNLTEQQAADFYSETTRKDINFDELPTGLDVVMLHGAVMLGAHGIAMINDKAKNDWGYLIALQMQNKMHREAADWHYMAGWSDRYVSIYELAKELSGA